MILPLVKWRIVKNTAIGVLDRLEQMMVVVPVDAEENKTQPVAERCYVAQWPPVLRRAGLGAAIAFTSIYLVAGHASSSIQAIRLLR